MKKTLAILLSALLMVALCVGIFVFSASAEGETKDYATTKADELWAATTSKAANVKVVQWGSAEGVSATIELKDGDSVELKDKGAFTAGTISYEDGVLTLDGVVYTAQDGAGSCLITADGALKAVVTGADFYGQIQNTGTAKDSNGYYVKDACLLLTSDDGSMFYGKGGNSLGSQSAIVVYGNVGFSIDCGTGYDGIITRQGQDTWNNAASLGHALILAPAVDSYVTGSGAGALIESRNGDIIFAGDATITIDYKYATGTATKYAVELSNIAKAGSAIRFLEDVNVNINTTIGGGVANRLNNGANDAIVFDTTGEVNLVSTAMNSFGWDTCMIYGAGGNIRVSSGKVLAAMTQVAYTGGCGVTVAVNGAGAGTGLFIENDAEMVVYTYGTVASGSNRLVGIWANHCVVDVSDNGKLASYYGQSGVATNNYSPLTFKVGGLHINDNANVLLYHLGGTAPVNNFFEVQVGNNDGEKANYTKMADQVGLHVNGGQLEIVAPKYAAVVANRTQNTFNINGGVVAIHSDSGNIFGCDFNNKDHNSSTTGYAYVGPIGKTENDLVSRNGVNDWVYMGEDAAYAPYYALDSYTELLGLKDFAQKTVLAKADASFTAPAAGNYKVTGTDIKVGEKAVPSGYVVALAFNDVVTGTDLTVAMTKEDVTPIPLEGATTSVTLKVGENDIVLDSKNKTALDGAAAYDVTAGTLTLKDAKDIKKISWTEGNLIIKAVGKNTVADAEGTELIVVPAAGTLTITGEGTLDISGKDLLITSAAGAIVIDGADVNLTATAAPAAANAKPATAAINGPDITIKGDANVTIDAVGAGIRVFGDKANAVADLSFVMADSANLTVKAAISALYIDNSSLEAAVGTIDITTTGIVKLEADLSGWSAATFYMAGKGGVDVNLKNVRLELVANQTDLSEVCVAFYAQAQTDVVVEDAVIIATVNVDSTVKANRGQAWYLASGSTMVTKTDAMLFLTTQGASAGMTWSPAASALHIHASTVTMEDNSVIVANATANKTPALALQTGTLIMNDDAQMFLSAADHNAINLWSNQAHSITVNDKAAIKLESRSGVMGGPGTLTAEFDRQNKDTSIRDIFFAKGGEAPAEMTAPEIPEVGGGEGGTTPPTSDATYTVAIVLLAVAAVAAGAVVVLRKRFN